MLTRTQWEIAGFVALSGLIGVASTIGYNYGESTSDNTVKQLELSIDSYKKSNSLNTEEFIDSAIKATNELRISIQERKQLKEQEIKITKLTQSLEIKKNDVSKLNTLISEKGAQISSLKLKYEGQLSDKTIEHSKELSSKNSELETLKSAILKYESKSVDFSLNAGDAKTFRGDKIQVGFVKFHDYENECGVVINDEYSVMRAGNNKSVGECKVVLSKCLYTSTEKSANFILVCP